MTAEAVGNFTAPTIIGGSTASATILQGSQSVTVSNLQSNTVYYYIVEATDASGNVSVTGVSTFSVN